MAETPVRNVDDLSRLGLGWSHLDVHGDVRDDVAGIDTYVDSICGHNAHGERGHVFVERIFVWVGITRQRTVL